MHQRYGQNGKYGFLTPDSVVTRISHDDQCQQPTPNWMCKACKFIQNIHDCLYLQPFCVPDEFPPTGCPSPCCQDATVDIDCAAINFLCCHACGHWLCVNLKCFLFWLFYKNKPFQLEVLMYLELVKLSDNRLKYGGPSLFSMSSSQTLVSLGTFMNSYYLSTCA